MWGEGRGGAKDSFGNSLLKLLDWETSLECLSRVEKKNQEDEGRLGGLICRLNGGLISHPANQWHRHYQNPPPPLGGGGGGPGRKCCQKIKRSKTNSPKFAKENEYRRNICIFVNKMFPRKCEVYYRR
jgi:hypothetical protein